MCLLEEVAKLPFGVSWRIFSALFCPGCDFGQRLEIAAHANARSGPAAGPRNRPHSALFLAARIPVPISFSLVRRRSPPPNRVRNTLCLYSVLAQLVVLLPSSQPTIGTLRRKNKTVATPYAPTPQEQAVLNAQRERRQARPPAPRVTVSPRGGTSAIGTDHTDQATGIALLMEAVGGSSTDFFSPFISQLVDAGSKGPEADEGGINFMLAVVKGIEPKDQMEAMLAAQMAAVHMATMTFARRLNHVDNIAQQDSAERAFNKLDTSKNLQVGDLTRG